MNAQFHERAELICRSNNKKRNQTYPLQDNVYVGFIAVMGSASEVFSRTKVCSYTSTELKDSQGERAVLVMAVDS